MDSPTPITDQVAAFWTEDRFWQGGFYEKKFPPTRFCIRGLTLSKSPLPDEVKDKLFDLLEKHHRAWAYLNDCCGRDVVLDELRKVEASEVEEA